MSLEAEITTVTRAGWKKDEQDAAMTTAPTYGYFKPRGEKIEGGPPDDIVIRYADLPVDNPAEFGTQDTSHKETRTKLTITDTATYHVPVSVSLKEDLKTRGNDKARERMLTMKRRDAAKSGVKQVNSDLVVGVASASYYSSRRMVGVRNTMGTGAYFNVPASTSWFASQVDASALSVVSLWTKISAMITLIIQQDGDARAGICSGVIWDKLELEAAGRERVQVGTKGVDTQYFGAETIVVRNCMIWQDPACASTAAYDLFILSPESWYVDYYSPTGEMWFDTGERTPVNSEVTTVNMRCEPTIRCGNRRQNGYFSSLS